MTTTKAPERISGASPSTLKNTAHATRWGANTQIAGDCHSAASSPQDGAECLSQAWWAAPLTAAEIAERDCAEACGQNWWRAVEPGSELAQRLFADREGQTAKAALSALAEFETALLDFAPVFATLGDAGRLSALQGIIARGERLGIDRNAVEVLLGTRCVGGAS